MSAPMPIPGALLPWYDRHARRLPWRVGPQERAAGARPDPYRVWLSEVMLQQTTVAAVRPYFEAFLGRWPTVGHLAAAPRAAVMEAWAGLGYYRRARNLHEAAAVVAVERGGRFPETAEGLRALPGVGAYTAAAIAAIAFDEPAPVVDGNVERVIARLFAIATPLPAAKPLIRERQARLTPAGRAGDYAQAMMDLGAIICTPKRPACAVCPLAAPCLARAEGSPERYPVKSAKADRPTRRGEAFVAVRPDGAVLLRRRPDHGLLGGMVEVPGSEWTAVRPAGDASPPQPSPTRREEVAAEPAGWPTQRVGESHQNRSDLVPPGAPLAADWRTSGPPVVHVFTHFRLELAVHHAVVDQCTAAPDGHWWSAPETLPGEALPSVMKKAIEAAVPGATKRPRRRAA